MSKKLVKAVQELLDQIEQEARGSYTEHHRVDGEHRKIFNEGIWRKADLPLYNCWKKVTSELSNFKKGVPT